MIFSVDPGGWLSWKGGRARCVLGRAGVCPAWEKREGDGKTPVGLWAIRGILWRADRIDRPVTELPASPIRPGDGWCDDSSHRDYNRLVTLPHPARTETLNRDDSLYDIIGILGYNDDPVVMGAGSAIFLHLARPDFSGTEGCVGLAAPDMMVVLAAALPGDALEIEFLKTLGAGANSL